MFYTFPDFSPLSSSSLSFFFFSSRRRHTISLCDWSSDVCSSDLLNMLTTSVMRQGGSEGVQPQPSRGSTPDCLICQCDPSFANPWRDDGFVSRLRLQSVRGPESEIHGFCHSVFRRECLTSLSRVASFAERITPGSVMSQVPPPCSAIKFV